MSRRLFWTPDRALVCNEMLLAGASYQAIGDALGTTRNAVAGYIKRDQPPRPVRESKAIEQPPKPKRAYRRHDDGHREPPAPLPEPVSGGVPTIELGPRQCRYVLSADAPWTHCSAETPIGSAWCQHHRKIVYQPQSRRDVG